MKTENELLIELEKLKIKKEEIAHKNKMAQLQLRKDIAIIYRSKKHLNKIKKQEQKLNQNLFGGEKC